MFDINDLLKLLLADFHEKLSEADDDLPRDFVFPDVPNKINVALGMRRVGKTTCVLQKIKHLIHEEKIALSKILYLNLEDDRLQPCSQAKLRELIEAFYALYPENHDKLCYLFFDEIQIAEDWQVLLRRIFDTKKVQIFLSGSSAKLLSKEIHTSLRGRALASEIWPYSFNEYLRANKLSFKSDILGQKHRDILQQQLQNYLSVGGFPEVCNTPTERRRDMLQSYVDVVIMRDIVERYGITNISLLKYLIKTLLKNTATGFAVNKFYKDIKSQGLSGAKNTLHDYLQYIEDAYLSFSVPLYSESIRKSQSNPRKIYAVDPGLAKAYSFGFNQNLGHLFETMVYLDLRRRGYEIYYYLTQERYEIDFVGIDNLGKPKLFQVVWDIGNEETLHREQRALQAAQNELKIEGEIITPKTYIENTWQHIHDFGNAHRALL